MCVCVFFFPLPPKELLDRARVKINPARPWWSPIPGEFVCNAPTTRRLSHRPW